ncbi:hypothetical protein K474DRAFT_1600018, partial [Panus rudis PR-1116 ss-1]
AVTAGNLGTVYPDYSLLGGRLEATSIYCHVHPRFSACVNRAYDYGGLHHVRVLGGLLTHRIHEIVQKHGDLLDRTIVHARDYTLSFASVHTLKHGYLLQHDGKVLERPQHMFMRAGIGVHGWDIDSVVEAYTLMSHGVYIHASPTLRNAECVNHQLSSSFVLDVDCTSIDSVFDTIRDVGVIGGTGGGGLGVSLHQVPSERTKLGSNCGSVASLTNVFDAMLRFCSYGSRRCGAATLYLEVWHADVSKFLDLISPRGDPDVSTRHVFYGVWVCDEFMRRVDSDGDWTLFCPTTTPLLFDTFGAHFEQAYMSYEEQNLGVAAVKARDLWLQILTSQLGTGEPFILYKDSINRKSNHMNLGVIKSSSLCAETMQYTGPSDTASCNLASINVSKFVTSQGQIDFARLRNVAKFVTLSLDRVIDETLLPTMNSRRSSSSHRPIALGIQGLADLYAIIRTPFDSPQARLVNVQVYETLYIGALEASIELAAAWEPYPSYNGSPMSQGLLQCDLWSVQPSQLWDWSQVRERLAINGVCNSLLIAQMPTASTSLILDTNESMEPFLSNFYVRRSVAGDFPMVNRHLVRDLVHGNLWTDAIRAKIIEDGGSVQHVDEIPGMVKALYKTAWELDQRILLDLAIARAPFICQSQSMNVYLQSTSVGRLVSSRMHFYSWEAGLKTGMYCLRSPGDTELNPFPLVDGSSASSSSGLSHPCVASDNVLYTMDTSTDDSIPSLQSLSIHDSGELGEPSGCEDMHRMVDKHLQSGCVVTDGETSGYSADCESNGSMEEREHVVSLSEVSGRGNTTSYHFCFLAASSTSNDLPVWIDNTARVNFAGSSSGVCTDEV